MEDRSFRGRVTEIGNSPIQATGAQPGAQRTATNFKVVVTLDEQIPDVRPGFTCTAEITTATRQKAVAVPIQALTVRELIYDEKWNIVRPAASSASPSIQLRPQASSRRCRRTLRWSCCPASAVKRWKESSLVRDGRAQYMPVKIGIAGERYFEVADGLNEGDRVITGPFDSVRNMFDGDLVQITEPGQRR